MGALPRFEYHLESIESEASRALPESARSAFDLKMMNVKIYKKNETFGGGGVSMTTMRSGVYARGDTRTVQTDGDATYLVVLVRERRRTWDQCVVRSQRGGQ